ncbi:MAG TPA: hypothetical protein VKE94_03945, partial [Gemmataceae bacterium]|nr:hypothetical protein [Gemmataceae bacterium]
ASEHHASLCPHCYAVVPMPEQAAPAAVSLSHGRLSACGYRVEIRDSGVIPFVEIESPERSARRLPLPGPRLTPQGAILFFVGPLVLAAFLMAVLPLRLGIFALIQVLTFLLPAIGFSIWIRIAGKQAAPASERAVGRAWAKLAPTLHERDYSLSDSSFLAGLALESIGRGDAQRRSRVLESVLAVTEKAAATQPGTLHHLAALRVLAIADAVESVGDPVTLTAVQVGRCFAGRLALPFADGLLASWRREWRTKANLARLRVLLLDRAFEAGFEVRDLLSAGQTAPQLGRILGTDDPGGLARLRLLWSLRPRRPWDRCGHAETAFSLAGATAGGQVLGKYADLLLYRAGTSHGNRNEAAQKLEIVVSGRGVIVSGKLFSEPVATLEVKRTEFGHELLVGGERFAVDGDPDQAATEVERWLRYYFHEFVPMVAEVYHWRSPHAASILRAWGTIGCPECQARFVARPGEIGITAGEEKAPGDSDERPVLAGK